jgi:hypothetical protein
MSYLLRVELPDVPGSLGRLASAIGDAGADIDAIEIVDRDVEAGTAIDDVFLKAGPGVMPDSIVSSCTELEGVRVLWISRYAAGGNLFLDLEAVESMTEDPVQAIERLVDALPTVFRVDWGLHLRREGEKAIVVHGTPAAPTDVPESIAWPANLEKGERVEVPESWAELVVAGAALNADELVVVGRRGGPQFLDSEVARLAHLIAMAASLQRNA